MLAAALQVLQLLVEQLLAGVLGCKHGKAHLLLCSSWSLIPACLQAIGDVIMLQLHVAQVIVRGWRAAASVLPSALIDSLSE